MKLPEPPGKSDNWRVQIDGSRVTTELLDKDWYLLAKESEVYAYLPGDLSRLEDMIVKQAQKIIDRITMAAQIEHDLGVKVYWK
jgi:hypothetical protein